jgi:hypothetical protein
MDGVRKNAMNTNLAIQLSEHTFAQLSEQAAAAGTTPAELAAAVVESKFAGAPAIKIDAPTARAAFERCFGSVDLGAPIGTDNAAIDADLARQYGASNGSA